MAEAESEVALTPLTLALEAMGTRFELVLPDRDGPLGLRAIGEAALAEIEECHRRLTRFDLSSLVWHLRRSPPGQPVPLDRDTFALFRDAVKVWQDSDGAFDPTVPQRAMDAIALDDRASTVCLSRPLPDLDLGGIAKGHALDLAACVLRAGGVTSAFLHGGTSSVVGLGAPPGRGGWRVALAGGGERLLRDEALSVSAVWNENPHPTLDPRTGQVVPTPRRVTVTGPSARLADAWSTAILVLGRVPDRFDPAYQVTITPPTAHPVAGTANQRQASIVA